jgi:Flp pilus assembly protein TadD
MNRAEYKIAFIYFALAFVTLIVYWQVMRCDFVDYDDCVYVVDNQHVQSGLGWQNIRWAFAAPHLSFWHPLTMLSHMLDCTLFGLKPWGHHLSSLLLHIANTLMLFLVLKGMTGAVWRSAFVAAAFALHPLHVESVAWVSERKDVLSTLFWMLTLAGYLWYVRRPGTARYLVTLFVFVLGLMAKPMLVTLPFVLLLLDYWPLKRINSEPVASKAELLSSIGKLALEKLPFFVLSAIASIVVFFTQQSAGALIETDVVSLRIRLANAFISYLTYLWKMVWPSRLAVYYPHPGNSLSMWQAAIAAVVLLIISFWVVCSAKKRGYLLTGWLWYVGTLFPVIGLVQVGSFAMADRFTYVPLIGVFIMVAWGVYDLCAGWRRSEIVIGILTAAALSLLGICTYFQTLHWRSSFILFEHAVKVTEGNFLMHNNLGNILTSQGKLDEAIAHLSQASQLRPNNVDICCNLGRALYSKGRFDEAILAFRRALQLRPDAEIYYNLGYSLQMRGSFDQALYNYLQARKLNPDWPLPLNGIAQIYLTHPDVNKRNVNKAVIFARRAAEMAKYEDPVILNTLAAAYASAGRLEKAVKTAEKALELTADKDKDMANQIRKQLQLYKQPKQ